MLIYRGYTMLGSIYLTNRIVFFLCVAFGVLLIPSGIFYYRNKTKNVDETLKTINSKNIFLSVILLFLVFFVIYRFGTTAIKLLYVALPVYVGIYFITKIYPKSLHIITYICTFNGFLYYIFNKLFDNIAFIPYIGATLAICILINVIAAVIFVYLKKNDGIINAASGKINFLPKQTNYLPLIATPVLSAIFYLLYFIFSVPAMRYSLFGMLTYLLICLIFYTFELMRH